ncbi:hypothetical protein Krodi_2589 [Dokdonia sp. 4H-3-7-5]|nr:hypothetical protein Krodi_2589 [Dokdonia sp. 4H-3-7-5]
MKSTEFFKEKINYLLYINRKPAIFSGLSVLCTILNNTLSQKYAFYNAAIISSGSALSL